MHKIRLLALTTVLLATLLISGALAQTNLTQIRDTIYNVDGTPFNGTIVITWNGSSSTLSGTVSPLSTSARVYNGALSVLLVPTTTAGGNSYYQVVYSSSDGTKQWTETWQVPPSSNALSVSGVRTSSGTGGSTGGSGAGNTGTGTASTQYATLPIALNQVTGLNSALGSLTASVTGNTSAIATLQTNVAGLQTSSTATTTTLAGLQTSVSGLQSSLNTLNPAVTSLQGSYATLNNAVTGLQTASTATGNTVTGLQSSYTTLTNSVAGLQSSITSLNSTTADLQTSLNGLNTTVTGVQSSLATANSNVTGLQTSYGALNTTVGGLQTSLNSTNTTVSGLQTGLASLTTTVNNLSAAQTASSIAFVDGDTPVGTINGTNAAFNLTATPSPSTSLALYRNGMLQKPGVDYSLTSAAITFNSASLPRTGDKLEAFYRVAGTGSPASFSDGEAPAGTINGSNGSFTLAAVPNPALSLELFQNGVLLAQGSDYTLSGSTLSFSTPAIPQSGDTLTAYYRH